MGNCLPWKSKRELTLLVAGVDNAGKTTVVNAITGQPLEMVAPTVGFSSQQVTVGDFKITFLDLGGGERIRDIWKNYLAEVYAVVFVLDSSDPNRMEENKTVLEHLVSDDLVQRKPVLLLANKQDIEGAMDEAKICDLLDLETLVNECKSPCRVEMCAAIHSKPGRKNIEKNIVTGFKWLLGIVNEKFAELKVRVTEDVAQREEKLAEEMKERAERVKKKREERERKEKEEEEKAKESESQTENVTNNVDDEESGEGHSQKITSEINEGIVKSSDEPLPSDQQPVKSVCDNVVKSSMVLESFSSSHNSSQSVRSALGDELLDDDDDEFHDTHAEVTSSSVEKKDASVTAETDDTNNSTSSVDNGGGEGSETVVSPLPEAEVIPDKKASKKNNKKNTRKNQITPVLLPEDRTPLSGVRLAPLSTAYSTGSNGSIRTLPSIPSVVAPSPPPPVVDSTSSA